MISAARIGDAGLRQGQVGFAEAVDHDVASSVARQSECSANSPLTARVYKMQFTHRYEGLATQEIGPT